MLDNKGFDLWVDDDEIYFVVNEVFGFGGY